MIKEGDISRGIHPDNDALGILENFPVLCLTLFERISNFLPFRYVSYNKCPAFTDIPRVNHLCLQLACEGRIIFFQKVAFCQA